MISLSRFVCQSVNYRESYGFVKSTTSFFWKCLSGNIALGSFTSFLWLFSLILNGVSFLPRYCRLHIAHSIRFCLAVCIVKYLPSFVCLLALECCCSFHLFAIYISVFYPMCPNNFVDDFASFKCCDWFIFETFFIFRLSVRYSNFSYWFW